MRSRRGGELTGQTFRMRWRGIGRAASSRLSPTPLSFCAIMAAEAPPSARRRLDRKPVLADVGDAVAPGIGQARLRREGDVAAEAVGGREARPLADQHHHRAGAEAAPMGSPSATRAWLATTTGARLQPARFARAARAAAVGTALRATAVADSPSPITMARSKPDPAPSRTACSPDGARGPCPAGAGIPHGRRPVSGPPPHRAPAPPGPRGSRSYRGASTPPRGRGRGRGRRRGRRRSAGRRRGPERDPGLGEGAQVAQGGGAAHAARPGRRREASVKAPGNSPAPPRRSPWASVTPTSFSHASNSGAGAARGSGGRRRHRGGRATGSSASRRPPPAR